MTMNQILMIMCILGSTFLLTFPDNTAASDQFYQAGGRFGKRHNDRASDYILTDIQKIKSMDKVPPRIERGFYISRYGKRNVNLNSDLYYFTLCLPSYGIYCDLKGLPKSLDCKKIHPIECSSLNHHDDEKIQLKPESDGVFNNY